MARRLVVIGGGISGLAAACGVLRVAGDAGQAVEVLLLEREDRVGGKARSLREDGWLVEAGPGGFLDNEPAMRGIIEAAGLEDQVVRASDAAANRYIVRGGRARLVAPHPLPFVRSGLLGPSGLVRMAGEMFVRRRRDPADESVWDFAARRIGRQAADRLIAPMVLGVFAGDARRLSLPAAFPRLAELEDRYGSLLRGMLALRGAGKRGKAASGGPAGPSGRLTSFRDGLQSLPLALSRIDGLKTSCGAEVERLERTPGAPESGRWRLVVRDREPVEADAVVLAGEPWAMAELLGPHSPEAARCLREISCPPVSVVALGFGAASLARVPKGFGALIPRGEGFRILGCLWETHLFEGRSPQGHLLIRMMLGGAVDPQAGELGEDELIAVARNDLHRLFAITETPQFRRVVRWPRAIPQYELGHLHRVAQIESECSRLAGLAITGNALHGVAFAKAAAAGLACGEAAARSLFSRPVT